MSGWFIYFLSKSCYHELIVWLIDWFYWSSRHQTDIDVMDVMILFSLSVMEITSANGYITEHIKR